MRKQKYSLRTTKPTNRKGSFVENDCLLTAQYCIYDDAHNDHWPIPFLWILRKQFEGQAGAVNTAWYGLQTTDLQSYNPKNQNSITVAIWDISKGFREIAKTGHTRKTNDISTWLARTLVKGIFLLFCDVLAFVWPPIQHKFLLRLCWRRNIKHIRRMEIQKVLNKSKDNIATSKRDHLRMNIAQD